MNHKKLIYACIYGASTAAVPGSIMVALQLAGYSDWRIVLFLMPILMILALPFTKVKTRMLQILLFAMAFILTAIQFLVLLDSARFTAFERLAERSKPLVTAIKQYEKLKGKPPSTLDELVPQFLSNIPGTGMPAYPNYEYKVITVEEAIPSNLDRPAWELSVPCPIGMLNWDVFFYWPTEQYPESIYGGSVKPIKNWAYVLE